VSRFLLLASAINGFLAVVLGAFGAHGLRAKLDALPDGAQRLGYWHTASQYHLVHALALGLAAWAAERTLGRGAVVAGYAWLVGIVLFSGSLYLMTLTGVRALGAVTPFGGLAFLVGWAALGVAAYAGFR
jgi:uncharacterized membrane protein YgdD (TMEM256/DUF423 family)